MELTTDDYGINAVIKKLGHKITEIRVCALNSIVLKLEHGLLAENDIVQEKNFFIKLLEWFNYKTVPDKDKVFYLLKRLSKHSKACEILISIGAVAFFTSLRNDIESCLIPQLDVVLERLFHLTESQVSTRDLNHCVYGKKITDNLENPASDEVNPRGFFNIISESVSSSIPPSVPAMKEFDYSAKTHLKVSPCLSFAGFPWHSLTSSDRHVLDSTGTSLCSPDPNVVTTQCWKLLNIFFRDFPSEIFIQRPALVKTLLTLISSRPSSNLLKSTLECINYLARGLVSRVNFYEDPSMYCTRQGFPFHGLRLKSREESLTSSHDRSQCEGRKERSRGDGRDEQSSDLSTTRSPISFQQVNYGDGNSMTSELLTSQEESEEAVTLLQSVEMKTPQFAFVSLLACLPQLKTESCSLALSIFQCLNQLLRLLEKTIRSDQLWDDTTTLGKEMQSSCTQLIEMFSEILLYHYHLDLQFGSKTSFKIRSSESHDQFYYRRLIFQTSAALFIKFLKVVMPLNQCSQMEMKSCTVHALQIISADYSLSFTIPSFWILSSKYLKVFNSEIHHLIVNCYEIGESFEYCYQFEIEYEKFSNRFYTKKLNLENCLNVVELVEKSIKSFYFKCNFDTINNIISILSEVSQEFCPFKTEDKKTEDLKLRLKKILLKFLAFPILKVKQFTYEKCLKIVRAAINISSAAQDPKMKSSFGCRFLLDSDVLYEISAHGLNEDCRLISSPAHEIFVLLMQSRLLVSPQMWWEFTLAIRPVFPVIQGFTGDSDLLRSAISCFITPSHVRETTDEDLFENVRSSLRGLFLRNRPSRAFFGAKVKSLYKTEIPQLETFSGLTDLFITETPLALVPVKIESTRTKVSYFEDSVVAIINVLKDKSGGDDPTMRVSALRQLCDVIQDAALMRAFVSREGLPLIVREFRNMIVDNDSVLTEMLRLAYNACIRILKLVLRRDDLVRQKFSRDRSFLFLVLHGAILCRGKGVSCLQESCQVMALLLFSDSLKVWVPPATSQVVPGEKMLSLPQALNKRYQIPFTCPEHDILSRNRPSFDLNIVEKLKEEPFHSYFRQKVNHISAKKDKNAFISKHMLLKSDFHQDISDEIATNKYESEIKMGSKLHDKIAIELSDPKTSCDWFVQKIESSTSHQSASSSFHLLRIMLMTSSITDQLCLDNKYFVNVLINKQSFLSVIERFLQIAPTCFEDEQLLTNITSLLDEIFGIIESSLDIFSNIIVTSSGFQNKQLVSDEFLMWATKLLLINPSTRCSKPLTGSSVGNPLFYMLESYEFVPSTKSFEVGVTPQQTRRRLCEKILRLFSRLSRFLYRSTCVEFKVFEQFHYELRKAAFVRLEFIQDPQYYDISSVEVALASLVHFTANRVKVHEEESEIDSSNLNLFSSDDRDIMLMKKILNTLVEMISTFDYGSVSSNMSYMGKGVTRCAAQCILHITRELASFNFPNWPKHLERESKTSSSSGRNHQPRLSSTQRSCYGDNCITGQLSLDWLAQLWSARDPRIRVSGVGIACLVSRCQYGAASLVKSFQHISGGIWEMALAVYLDHSECAAVRSQACQIINNLMCHPFGGKQKSSTQGPIIKCINEDRSELGQSLHGLPALVYLLSSSHIINHIALILTSYHAHSCVRSPGALQRFISKVVSRVDKDRGGSNTGVEISTIGSKSNESLNGSSEINASISPVGQRNDLIKNGSEQHFKRTDDEMLMNSWRSLATPELVSSTCHFLVSCITKAPTNTITAMLEADLLYYFTNLTDQSRVQCLLKKLTKREEISDQSEVPSIELVKRNRRCSLLSDLVKMQASVLQLLYSCLKEQRESVAVQMIDVKESYLDKLSSFFTLAISVKKIKKLEKIASSCDAIVFNIFTELMTYCLQSKVFNIQVFHRNWKQIYVGVKRCLQDTKDIKKQLSCVKFLLMFFQVEHMRTQMIKGRKESLRWMYDLLGDTATEEHLKTMTLSMMSHLERLVIHPSSIVSGESNVLMVSCAGGLQNLFACSYYSTKVAVREGFIKSTCDLIEEVNSKLVLIHTTKPFALTSQYSKIIITNSSSSIQLKQAAALEDTVFSTQPLLSLIKVLTNLLSREKEYRLQACDAGLGFVLYKLWKTSLLSTELRMFLMKLILNFTAHCEKACTSLSVVLQAGTQSPCLMSLLVDYCKNVHVKIVQAKSDFKMLNTCFQLMNNVSVSTECRNIIWKANLMDLFPAVADKVQCSKRSKYNVVLLINWLKFILCLSAHSDGQQNILKIKDILLVLLELHKSNIFKSGYYVIKIIRNLCFHQPSKPRISCSS